MGILLIPLKLKMPLMKDATASVFQHCLRFLGPKNDLSLNILNFEGRPDKSVKLVLGVDTSPEELYWYDSYQILIDLYLERSGVLEGCPVALLDCFKRKTLKKVIMTIPYAATHSSA